MKDMNLTVKYICFLFVFIPFAAFSQEVDEVDSVFSDNYGYHDETGLNSGQVYEMSEETMEMQDESDEAREEVLFAEDLIAYVRYLMEIDSLVVRFAKYEGDSRITDYFDNVESLHGLERRFDVIEQNAKDTFFYCEEVVYNQNKAWDYIYERLYNQNGNLIYFARRYNTYNSGCAEVAFERSEYFWDKEGKLIKKTYEIYDSNNQPLEEQDCLMDREFYDKIMDKNTFLSVNPLPLNNNPE